MKSEHLVLTLDEVLDQTYRRCYVSAEPVDRSNPAHVAAARELDGKYCEPDGEGPSSYRRLALQFARLAAPDGWAGIASIEFSDKDNCDELTWYPATNAWTYRWQW